MPACRATVAQTVSPQKHCTLGATSNEVVRPSFQFFRFHFLSYNSPISRFCPSGDASDGEWTRRWSSKIARTSGRRTCSIRIVRRTRANQSSIRLVWNGLRSEKPVSGHAERCDGGFCLGDFPNAFLTSAGDGAVQVVTDCAHVK